MTFFPLAATSRPIFDILMFSLPENQNNSANKADSTPNMANSKRQLQRVSVRFPAISFDLIPKRNYGLQTSCLLGMAEIIWSEISFTIVNYVDLKYPITERILKC